MRTHVRPPPAGKPEAYRYVLRQSRTPKCRAVRLRSFATASWSLKYVIALAKPRLGLSADRPDESGLVEDPCSQDARLPVLSCAARESSMPLPMKRFSTLGPTFFSWLKPGLNKASILGKTTGLEVSPLVF